MATSDLFTTPQQGTLGTAPSVPSSVPAQPSAFALQAQEQARRDAVSNGAVFDSMLRQNWLPNNAMAELAGAGMPVDPNYNVFNDPRLDEMSKTVSEQYLPYLWRSTSATNLIYNHGRILEKQADDRQNADFPLTGLTFQLADPTYYLMGSAAGKASQVAHLAAGVKGTGAVLAGLATGAVENAALEEARQSVSMEDDKKAVVMAGLMGATMSSPFVIAGARKASRVRQAAQDELDMVTALDQATAGKPLSPEQVQLIHDTHAKVQEIQAMEAPGLSEADYMQKLREYDARWHGVEADAKQFSDDLGNDIRSKAQDLMDQFYPLESPEVHAAKLEDLRLKSQMSDLELQRQARALQREQNLAAKKTAADAAAQQAESDGFRMHPTEPLADTAMASAMRKAMKAAEDKQAQVDAQSAHLLSAQEANVQASTKAAKRAAWDAADAADAARKAKDFEAAIRQRELQRMVADDPWHEENSKTPAEAPAEPVADQTQAPQGDTSVAPVEAPVSPPIEPPQVAPAESHVGKVVSWQDAKSGEMMEGKVQRVSPTGKLVIQNEMGELKAVSHTDVHPASEAPSGFLHGTVGAAQAHMIGYVDQFSSRFTGWQSLPGTNGKIKIPPRLDLYAFLNESKIAGVRTLAHKLIKDPVGQKDGSAQGFTASEWRYHLKTLIGGEFHRVSKAAYQDAVKAGKVSVFQAGQFRRDFYEAASQVLRGDHTVLQDFDPAVQPHIHKVAAALRKGLDKHLAEAVQAGVKGAEGVPPNSAYVNRIWRQDKIRAAMDAHGPDAVYQLVANAMTGTGLHGPLTGDVAKAKAFLGVVMKLEYSPALQNINLAAKDMGSLRDELRSTKKLTDADIDHIVDVMFEKKETSGGDAGQATPLKFRFDLDETVGMKTAAGDLRVSDLLENDARVLLDRYGSTMGGHTAMAKVGIRSQAEWAEQMRVVEAEIAKDPVNLSGRAAAEIAWLNDIQANILGRPMSSADFSGTARFAAAFRGYARSTVLGQLGLSAAFEMKQAIGIMGVRAFMQQMPTFASFIASLRRGYLPEQGLARDVMMIGGWGQEKAAAYARAREIDEGFAADFLTGIEHKANEASHAVDAISGNASFTSLTKQISAMMSVQQLHDYATGLKTLTPSAKLRLAGQGLDGQMAQDVMDQLKQFADVSNDRVTSIRYEDWLAHDREAYEQFQLYMSRQVRDAIQDHDLGETLPFMHSTLGKMFGELKTFFFVSHAKNLLKNVHYGDGTTMQIMLMSMMGESLAYAIQQAINNPSDLDKRLSPEVMGPAVWSRMATAGFTQMIADTGYTMATGHSMLMQGSTASGTNNRNLMMTPSLQLASKLANAPGTLVRGLGLGTRPMLQSELKDDWSLVPGLNTYGLRGVGQWLADGLPKSAPTSAP